MATEIIERLDRIDRTLSNLDIRVDRIGVGLVTLSDRLARQVAVTEALRSDMRVLTGLVRSIFTAIQALASASADLSVRVTDLENPEPKL